jgi:hypothetical protein
VRRDGYYGKHKEFTRWECVPGNGDPPHYLSHDLMEAAWDGSEALSHGGHQEPASEDGFLLGDHHKFLLAEKAQLLIAVAQGGMSMRAASIALRAAVFERRERRAPSGKEISSDGRLGRDWVAQYADMLAHRYLPTRWPHSILVASSDVHLKNGPGTVATPVPYWSRGVALGGRHYYSIFAAVGFGPGSEQGQVWSLAAFPKRDEFAAREFFTGLAGQPEIVVCDDAWALASAASGCFPGARVYLASPQLLATLRRHLRRADLYNRRRWIFQLLRESGNDLVSDADRWQRFLDAFDRYERAAGSAPERTRVGIAATRRWIDRHAEAIELLTHSEHWPRDTRPAEEVLQTVQRRLGGRQRLMRNLPRLNSLLRLMAIELRGEANLRAWTRVLGENHRDGAGKPPRRHVEGKLLRR